VSILYLTQLHALLAEFLLLHHMGVPGALESRWPSVARTIRFLS
jgi:hypothetical protein